MPKGVAHAPSTSSELSLHLTLGLEVTEDWAFAMKCVFQEPPVEAWAQPLPGLAAFYHRDNWFHSGKPPPVSPQSIVLEYLDNTERAWQLKSSFPLWAARGIMDVATSTCAAVVGRLFDLCQEKRNAW